MTYFFEKKEQGQVQALALLLFKSQFRIHIKLNKCLLKTQMWDPKILNHSTKMKYKSLSKVIVIIF